MQDEKIDKKQVKFYSDLSAEEKANIIYLPDVSKAVSSKSSFKEKGVEDNVTLVQSKKVASSDSSFDTVRRVPHPSNVAEKTGVIPFHRNEISPIDGKESLSQEENRTAGNFHKTSFSENKEIFHSEEGSSHSLKHSGNQFSSSSRVDKGKPYYELLEKEKRNVLYLPDFFKKKTAKHLSSQNKGVVIPFPAPKTSSKPAAVTGVPFLWGGLKSQNVLAFACLLMVSGVLATAVTGAIHNRSKEFVANKIKKENNSKKLMLTKKLNLVPKTRNLAEDQNTLIPKWIKKQTSSEPSHIIKYIKKKEIKITRAVSL